VQDAFLTLVIIVVALGGVVALYAVATSGHAYREIGKGGLDVPDAEDAPAAPGIPDDRDEEIRELLEARNARRARNGQAPLDVEAQLAALTGAGPDAGGSPSTDIAGSDELREELRAVVEARNRRRERAGLDPLDVGAEIERRLRDLN
jgi:hypothetical protein